MLRSHRLLWFSTALAVAAAGCAGDTPSGETSGALSLRLELAPGIEVDEVRWTISGGNMAPMTGVIDTSAPGATASVEVFGLPPADLYIAELEAISEDGEVVCRGDAPFRVDAGQTTDVMVMLNCEPPERLGGVRVEGEPNFCPVLEKVVVSPLQTSLGNTIDLYALATDPEGDPFFYNWFGTGGDIEGRSKPSATYTCEELGEHYVGVAIFNPESIFDCHYEEYVVPVRCVTGDGMVPMCLPAGDNRCADGVFGDVVPCCELSEPEQEPACTGDESLDNPASCTATGNTIAHKLTVLEIAPSCNDGYDLDSCDGRSCIPGGLAPFEGVGGVDNALTGLQPLFEAVGGDLGGLNQAFSDGLCGFTTVDSGGTQCSVPITAIEIWFFVDANLEENCANVTVQSGPNTNNVIFNLSDPTGSGTVCASGTIGTLPLTLVGFSGELENVVIRMTMSELGFSDGLMGATVDETTAVTIAELLIEGGGAVVSQTLEINDELEGNVATACNALSAAFAVGGTAEPPLP